MGITVQFESYEEMIAFANKLVGQQVTQEKKETKSPKAEKPITSESEVSKNTAQVGIEEELPQDDKPAKAYTLEEVRSELAKLTRAGKQKQVKELLGSFGAKNLTSVDPKDYASLMEKAGAL